MRPAGIKNVKTKKEEKKRDECWSYQVVNQVFFCLPVCSIIMTPYRRDYVGATLSELPYIRNLKFSKKGNAIFDCLLCNLQNVPLNHTYWKKHCNAENKVKDWRAENDKTFQKWYAETYIQIKYEPWRQKLQRMLENFYETGEWNEDCYRCAFPESKIESVFERAKQRDAMAILELKIVRSFMKVKSTKRKLCDTYSEDSEEPGAFEITRVKYANQILKLVLPFLVQKGKYGGYN